MAKSVWRRRQQHQQRRRNVGIGVVAEHVCVMTVASVWRKPSGERRLIGIVGVNQRQQWRSGSMWRNK